MTIAQVCNLLKAELYENKYDYGFYLNGKKYRPDMNHGFDEEYYALSITIYRVQNPIDTIREKIGTCIDAVVVMKTILDNHSIPCKIWLLHHKTKNSVHTILTFEAENKIVYLELTPQSNKPWYGQEIIYESEHDLIKEYQGNNYDILNVTNDIIIGTSPDFLLKFLKG